MLPESPEKAPTIWLLVLLHAATAWLPPVLTATTNMVMPFLVTATMVVIPVCVVVRITVIPVTTAWFDCVMEFLMATVTIFMATVVKAPSVPSVAIVDRSDTASAVAEAAGLPVAHKPDSQEICFVPDNDYAGFIERETNEVEKPGNFVSTSGEILGTHKGIGHYTIGQRKGLGIAFGEPMFVVEICPETNEVVLGKNDEVFTDWLKANQVNHMAVDHFEVGQKVTARIRYNHGGAKAVISEVTEDSFSLTFEEPVRAVTPGQAVVLYDGDYVLGGGTICRKEKED